MTEITLSELAQRIYGVLVVSAPVVHLSALEKAIGEQFGIGGPGWTALAELDSAGLIEILYDFRYRLTPLAWQALLAAERARAERRERRLLTVMNKVLAAWRRGASVMEMSALMGELAVLTDREAPDGH